MTQALFQERVRASEGAKLHTLLERRRPHRAPARLVGVQNCLRKHAKLGVFADTATASSCAKRRNETDAFLEEQQRGRTSLLSVELNSNAALKLHGQVRLRYGDSEPATRSSDHERASGQRWKLGRSYAAQSTSEAA